jgi:hypothetical protein
VHIISPTDGEINTILNGASVWGDVVYVRDQAELRHYVFANDASDKVWIIDSTKQEVIKKVGCGQNPFHLYAIPWLDEVWSHLDGEGKFDVFRMSEPRYRAAVGVRALLSSVRGNLGT